MRIKERILIMKKAIAIILALLLLVGCANNTSVYEPVEIPEVEGVQPFEIAPLSADVNMEAGGASGHGAFGRHRPRFHSLPAPFADLVGRDVFRAWRDSRSMEERLNENVATAFIVYFDISREDFERANEEVRRHHERRGRSPQVNSNFEVYPVDLIFTFDNEAISEFFLWENSPAIHERELGMGEGIAPLAAQFNLMYEAQERGLIQLEPEQEPEPEPEPEQDEEVDTTPEQEIEPEEDDYESEDEEDSEDDLYDLGELEDDAYQDGLEE